MKSKQLLIYFNEKVTISFQINNDKTYCKEKHSEKNNSNNKQPTTKNLLFFNQDNFYFITKVSILLTITNILHMNLRKIASYTDYALSFLEQNRYSFAHNVCIHLIFAIK